MKEEKKEYKLPRVFAEKWIEALRSGKYQQGRGQLYSINNDNYCCLGVACEVAGHTKNIIAHGYNVFIDAKKNRIIGNKIVFPKIPTVLKGSNGLPQILAEMNDSGISFDGIADWIEDNVEFVN